MDKILEKGKNYNGTFFIDFHDFEKTCFKGILQIGEDNSIRINSTSTDCKINNQIIELIKSAKEFILKGELEFGKITCVHTQCKKHDGNKFLLVSDEAYFGDNYLALHDKECINISNGVVDFSGFDYIISEYDGSCFNLKSGNVKISYYKNRNATGINFHFSKRIKSEEFYDLITDINNFFTLLNYKPSEIISVRIILNKEYYQAIIHWLPIDSRNHEEYVIKGFLTIETLADYFDKWISFCQKTEIATQQYFAIQSMNGKIYENIILSNLLFALDGFLSVLFKKKKGNSKDVCNHANKKSLSLRDRIEMLIDRHKELSDILIRIGYDKKLFIDNLVKYRNAYAHDSDKNISIIRKVDAYSYDVIVNYMIRTLLIKEVLGLDVVIPFEDL